jgi:polar amino acid transport system substrate-binding protein
MKSITLVVNTTVRVVALCLFAASVLAEPIVFETTDTPPYWSAVLPDNGIGGSILKLLSNEAGVKYSLDYLPVKRFRNSTAPYIVGDPEILLNQKNRAIFPIAVFRSAFFYYKPRHDVINPTSMRDLRGRTLGVLRGTLEDKASFTRYDIKVEESDSVESLLRKLKRGRIDLCIMVASTGHYKIQTLFPSEAENFVQVYIARLDRPVAVMIDIDNPEGKVIARRYRQALVKTLHSQTYRDILNDYYDSDSSDREEALNKFIQYYAHTWDTK